MKSSIVIGTIPVSNNGKVKYKVVRRMVNSQTLSSREKVTAADNDRSPVLCILPAYNEEVSIGSIVLKAKRYVDRVIVVDDGSSDETAEVASLAGANVIRHEKNLGKGAAIKSGLEYARNLNARALVLLDSDGQHDPDEIPMVLKPVINNEADFVNGSRFLKDVNNIPKYRRIGQEILTLATNFGGQLKITDSQSGFRAFSRVCLKKIKVNSNGFGIESEMLMEAAGAGLRIMEVPISCRYNNIENHTKHPITHGCGVLGTIIKEMQIRRPLAFFCIPGAILFLIGMILCIQTTKDWLLMKQFWIGDAIFSMGSVIIGIFSIFTGLILHSISRIRR
jgi:glycosyltransferase involved in cell wall biosynthesis